MSTFTPPPTYASVVLYDENAADAKALLRSVRFNPIWLKWFVDVAEFITASGGAGGADHQSLASLQGGSATERYHLTSAQQTALIAGFTGTGSIVRQTSPTLVTPALGTPASGVVTNLTGTAAGVSIGGNAATATLAATVTTNADLTGPVVTSVGNAASLNMEQTSNSIAGDVALNNTANYFTGPTIAQGASGVWFASGTVTLQAGALVNTFYVKLWDGTNLMASAVIILAATTYGTVSLSGFRASPAGNIRISVKDISGTDGLIIANASGEAKDSTLTVIRIAN